MLDINELRREVRKRHAAATAKVSRLRNDKGVEVGGTKYDPRRDPANIKRYTRQQLNSYLNQLNGFTARTNGFVAGSEGAPIPIATWRKYKSQETRYNAKGRRRFQGVADIKLHGQDMTLAQRQDMMRPNIIRAGGEASNRPFAPVERKPSQIRDVEALNKLIRSFNKKNSRGYLSGYIRKQRQQAKQLVDGIGVSGLNDLLKNLTDDQFDTLFNETSFASDAGSRYGLMQLAKQGKKSGAHDAVMETAENDLLEQIKWAASLPPRKRR